jgi:hypothetical protein
MTTTNNLLLPYIQASQEQKHVTHNEGMRLLDGLVQTSAVSALTSPPSSPADGDIYLVSPGATDAWAGWDNSLAMWADNSWFRFVPKAGWRTWLVSNSAFLVFNGGDWGEFGLNVSPNGAGVSLKTEEEELVLSGASVTSTIGFPDQCRVIGVSSRTVEEITGATSYRVGDAASDSKFGSSLGTAAGSTNQGTGDNRDNYTFTPVIVTAEGGNFSSGVVRIAIHYLQITPPQA